MTAKRSHQIVLATNSRLQNARSLLPTIDFFPHRPNQFELVFPKNGFFDPVILSTLAAWGAHWANAGVPIHCTANNRSLRQYAERMGLFPFLGVHQAPSFRHHESAGKFIALTRLSTSVDVKAFIADTVPLFRGHTESAAIRYCLSELTRNVVEHAGGVPALACAQYYPSKKTVVIGVADTGIGIRESLAQSHQIPDDKTAVIQALKPGITRAVPHMYGSPDNAGAGLFYTKSIAICLKGQMLLWTGNTAIRIRPSAGTSPNLNPDPTLDRHDLITGLPPWIGTVVGLELCLKHDHSFEHLIGQIRQVFSSNRPGAKPKIRFT